MSSLVFKTFSAKSARVVALVTLLIGIAGLILTFWFIKTGQVKISLPSAIVSIMLTAIGVTGPMSVMLFNDKLVIRKGAWNRPNEFAISEIWEVNFSKGKMGGLMTVRTKDNSHEFRFAQSGTIVKLFAQNLKSLKVRVTGKH